VNTRDNAHYASMREACLKDTETLLSWWNDGRVMAHAGFPKGLGISASRVEDIIRAGSAQRKLFILEYQGRPIGEMNYKTPEPGTASIGIKICEEEFQDKGLGKVYLYMLINLIFEKLHYESIILDTNEKNARARHFYEKIGFRQKAISRNSWTDQLGNPQSTVFYEMCRRDWEEISGGAPE